MRFGVPQAARGGHEKRTTPALANRFDAKLLKTLRPGSVYSEPGGQNHFAQTNTTAVIVEISGYGPTDTHYFDSANDPNSKGKK